MTRQRPSIEVVKLAREIANLKRLVRSRTPQLGNSAIEDGTIAEYDETGQIVQVIGTQFDGTHTAASVSGPNPPQPSRAYAVGSPGGFTVQWDGLFESLADIAPMDFLRVDVVEDVDSGVDPIAKPPTASITSPRGGTVFVATTDQATRYVYLVVRSESGKASEPSFGVAVDPISSGGSDGEPPADAPSGIIAAPFAIRAGMVSWNAPDNADPITYRVYMKDSSGVDPAVDELVSTTTSGYAVVDRFGGELLDTSTTYYAVVVAEDDDGVGPASAEVSFQPRQAENADISADYAYFGDVEARQLRSGVAGADIAVAGSLYVADIDDATGLPIENTIRWIVDGNGAQRAYRMSDGKEMLTIDPVTGSFVWRGDGEFDHATFINGTIQGGGNEIAEGGVLVLQKGVTTPKNGPSVSIGYDTVQTQVASTTGLTSDGSGGFYTTALSAFPSTPSIIHIDSAGVIQAPLPGPSAPPASEVHGIVRVDSTHIYALVTRAFGSSWQVDLHTEAGGYQSSSNWNGFGPDAITYRKPTIGYDSSTAEILIGCSITSSDPDLDDAVVIGRYTFNAGGNLTASATAPQASDIPYAHPLAWVACSSFDLGTRHYQFVLRDGGGATKALSLLGDSLPANSFHTGAPIIGMAWDGANFHSLSSDGQLRKYEAGSGNRWSISTDENWYVAYTWYQAAGGYETVRSPYTSVTMKKRAKLIVQTSPLPSGSSNPPSEARVYLKKGTTSPGLSAATVNMRRQATSATGDPPVVQVVNADFGTSNNPAAATFPTTGSPAEIQSADLSQMVSANDTEQLWTPVLTASTNPTGYTATGRYRIDGDSWVRIEYDITFPSAASMGSGQLILNVPSGITLATPFEIFAFGLRDVSANDMYAVWAMVDTDGTHLRLQIPFDPAGTTRTSGNLNPTNLFTIAAGDKLVGIINARKA